MQDQALLRTQVMVFLTAADFQSLLHPALLAHKVNNNYNLYHFLDL
jgi:hypothetical protein